jgi:hypothetical protein
VKTTAAPAQEEVEEVEEAEEEEKLFGMNRRDLTMLFVGLGITLLLLLGFGGLYLFLTRNRRKDTSEPE